MKMLKKDLLPTVTKYLLIAYLTEYLYPEYMNNFQTHKKRNYTINNGLKT